MARYRAAMGPTIEPLTVGIAPEAPLDGPRRLLALQDAMSLAGDVSVADSRRLTFRFTSMNLGIVRTVDMTASTFRLARDAARATSMPREHVIVNLVEAGRWEGTIAGRSVRMAAGDLLLSQATNPLDLVFENAHWLGILIPRVEFERSLPWNPRLDGTVHRAGSIHAVLLGAVVRALCSLPTPLSPRDGRRAVATALASVQACLRGGTPSLAGGPCDGGDQARSIRRFIVERLNNPALNIALLCATFGLSRSALHRVMGEDGDIATVIRSLRLRAAARDLSDPVMRHAAIGEIGTRWGFRDERTFRRAFLREFNAKPSEIRDGSKQLPLSGPVEAEFRQWLMGR